MTSDVVMDPQEQARLEGDALMKMSLQPILDHLEGVGATGELSADDRITLQACVYAAACAHAITSMLCESSGMPKQISQLAIVAARKTAQHWKKELEEERRLWELAHKKHR